jgi:hypothetical protein
VRLGEQLGQPFAAARVRGLQQYLVVDEQQVERDHRGGCGLREQFHTGGGRVDALAEQLEVEPGDRRVAPDHDQLHVDRAAHRELVLRLLDDLREVPGHGLPAPAGQLHLVAVTEHDAAEAVPLGLVRHPVRDGDLGYRLGQHRLQRRHDRQVHALQCAPKRPSPGT